MGFRIDTLDTSSPALVDACITLIVNAFADPERYSRERLSREICAGDPIFYRQFFVAMQAGEVLAVGGVKAADWATKTHLLYLSAVTPERRGEGIGRALIKARIEWIESTFQSGRILVSAARTRRFRDLGFREVRNSAVGGKHLLMRRF
ncbi:MAG: GNAT family N-acetyltransferase [Azonexus sp.]|jgi:GNAT superfamily N-acetyltransferase|nr:GNAT family N-acetyltransferase [Azonexus sp.]